MNSCSSSGQEELQNQLTLFPADINESPVKKTKSHNFFPIANMKRGIPIGQHRLFSTDPIEWVSPNDIVHLLLLLLPQLDLSEFLAKYRSDGVGAAFYDPQGMLGIVLYAMARGEQSSRKIEISCKYDLGYRLAGNSLCPDHVTIFRFKKEFDEKFENIFEQIAIILLRLGVTRFGVIAIDGSKFGANASLSANHKLKWIQSKLRQLFNESMNKDEIENEAGLPSEISQFELPDNLSTNERLKAKFNRAIEEITEEQRIKAEKQQALIDKRTEEENESGKKKVGKPLSEPQFIPLPNEIVNITDPESKIMKTRSGFIQGYNGQILVDENQFVLAAHLTNNQNDQHQLPKLVDNALSIIKAAGIEEKPHTVLADAGYCNYEDILYESLDGPQLLIATSKEYNVTESDINDGALFQLDEICRRMGDNPPPMPILAAIATFVWNTFIDKRKPTTPEGVAKTIMAARLRSSDGKELYRKRKTVVEPVFGDIKQNRKFRRFSLKGKSSCEGEFFLALICHNLIKLLNMGVIEKLRSGKQYLQNKMSPIVDTPVEYVQMSIVSVDETINSAVGTIVTFFTDRKLNI